MVGTTRALQLAPLAALAGYFLFKCHGQVDKFLGGKTTIAKHMEDGGPMDFPGITVCPGKKLEYQKSRI